MISKKKVFFYLTITLIAGFIAIILASQRMSLNHTLRSFLGGVIVATLFTSSVLFFRLISTDTGFASWKKFMKYFAPIAIVIAFFGGFNDGGGSWAVGGHDSEITMWLLGIAYVVGSAIIIVKHRKY